MNGRHRSSLLEFQLTREPFRDSEIVYSCVRFVQDVKVLVAETHAPKAIRAGRERHRTHDIATLRAAFALRAVMTADETAGVAAMRRIGASRAANAVVTAHQVFGVATECTCGAGDAPSALDAAFIFTCRASSQ